MQFPLNRSIIGFGTENSIQVASQPRGSLTRCLIEVPPACAARLCCVLPPQAQHHRQPPAMSQQSTECTHTAHTKECPDGHPTAGPTYQMTHHDAPSLRCPPVLRSAFPGAAPPQARHLCTLRVMNTTLNYDQLRNVESHKSLINISERVNKHATAAVTFRWKRLKLNMMSLGWSGGRKV